MKKKFDFWVITGKYGFYTGTFMTRKMAIEEHCNALYGAGFYKSEWKHARKNGDRVVKVKFKVVK